MAKMVPDGSGRKCKWRGCPSTCEIFSTVEKLLEHVLLVHIPKVVKDEDGEDEVICEWGSCEMGTIRGDLDKKTAWMQNHFKTRHAKSAKTFKCLFKGCEVVRATSQEMETHLRTFHPVKNVKKSEKAEKPAEICEKPKNPVQKRIWKIEDGKVTWEPPIRVTKKTIVYYDDGPRYVFPSNCGRCNYDSNESELENSDEYWSTIDYSDDEQTKKKAWRPPKLYNPMLGPANFEFPEGYSSKNLPVTDSEEEERRKRPKRVKKSKKSAKIDKKRNLHEIVDKLKSSPKKEAENGEKRWVGSFWYQYLQKEPERPETRPTRPKPEKPNRPSRACRKNVSLCEIDEEIEAFEESFDSPKVPKSVLLESKSPKSPKSPKSLKRPRRACRPVGSLEEVPFDVEIFVDFNQDSPKKRKKRNQPPSPSPSAMKMKKIRC